MPGVAGRADGGDLLWSPGDEEAAADAGPDRLDGVGGHRIAEAVRALLCSALRIGWWELRCPEHKAGDVGPDGHSRVLEPGATEQRE